MNRLPSRQSAFTFLELMLAVTVLGLVMTAVFSTWSAGLNGWKKTAGVSDNFQRDRIVMGTLADLTKSIVMFNNKDGLYNIKFEHQSRGGDSISFVTASTALLPASEIFAAGMRRVTIALDRDERGRTFLGLANAPALALEKADRPAVPHSLSAEVSGFAVRLRHPRDGTMKDRWDEPNLPPSAIEYTIAFGRNDGRTPPVVVTRTFELPVAQSVLQSMGQVLSQKNTTNTVTRRGDINLSDGGDPF